MKGERTIDDKPFRYGGIERDFAVSSRYNFCPNCGCRMKGADDE